MRPDAPSRRYAQPVLGHERLAPGHPRNGFGRIGERHDQLAGKRQRGGGRPTIVEMSASMSENSTFSRRECSDRGGRVDDDGGQVVICDHCLDQPLGGDLAALVGADRLRLLERRRRAMPLS